MGHPNAHLQMFRCHILPKLMYDSNTDCDYDTDASTCRHIILFLAIRHSNGKKIDIDNSKEIGIIMNNWRPLSYTVQIWSRYYTFSYYKCLS